MSCNKTRDVFSHFAKGFNIYWSNNTLPVYVGSNNELIPHSLNGTIFLSVPTSNWKQETLEQLSLLQSNDPSLSHVIVMLDDFILKKNVDNFRLLNMLHSGKLDNIKYLRLKRLEEGFIKRINQLFLIKKEFYKEKIFLIRKSHPYFSSLQIAIWDIGYLKSCILNCDNIWNFETNNTRKCEHYSVLNNLFFYRHIVEKGKWETYASSYCKKHINYFNPGNREFQSFKFQNKLINYLRKVKFLVFGYSFFSLNN